MVVVVVVVAHHRSQELCESDPTPRFLIPSLLRQHPAGQNRCWGDMTYSAGASASARNTSLRDMFPCNCNCDSSHTLGLRLFTHPSHSWHRFFFLLVLLFRSLNSFRGCGCGCRWRSDCDWSVTVTVTVTVIVTLGDGYHRIPHVDWVYQSQA